MDAAFLQGRIDSIKLQIVAYEEAILALTAGGIASYELDTGQSKTKVTKQNLNTMNATYQKLMNMLDTYEVKLNGGGTIIAGPSRLC